MRTRSAPEIPKLPGRSATVIASLTCRPRGRAPVWSAETAAKKHDPNKNQPSAGRSRSCFWSSCRGVLPERWIGICFHLASSSLTTGVKRGAHARQKPAASRFLGSMMPSQGCSGGNLSLGQVSVNCGNYVFLREGITVRTWTGGAVDPIIIGAVGTTASMAVALFFGVMNERCQRSGFKRWHRTS